MISSPQLIEAESIGSIAVDSQSIARQGTIMGKTSRGIFIKSSSKWIVFISREPYRSPLTINLSDNEDPLQQATRSMPVQISPAGFSFSDLGLEISTRKAQIWLPNIPDDAALSNSERQSRLEVTSQRIMKEVNGSGLSSLLPYLVESPGSFHQSTETLSSIEGRILDIQREPVSPNHLPNAEKVFGLLGTGLGLTPSGDDFIIGFLLALNRWRDVLAPNSDLKSLNQQVVAAANHKTTTLSANLIECAASGLADERLIGALDWLMSGDAHNFRYIDELLAWGNSSGVDVFVGFSAALTLTQRGARKS